MKVPGTFIEEAGRHLVRGQALQPEELLGGAGEAVLHNPEPQQGRGSAPFGKRQGQLRAEAGVGVVSCRVTGMGENRAFAAVLSLPASAGEDAVVVLSLLPRPAVFAEGARRLARRVARGAQ